MDWLLGGPAAPFLGKEDDFNSALVPPPPGIFLDNGINDAGVAFCPEHGYGPCPARRGIAFCPMQGYGASPPQPAVIFNPPSPTPTAELEEYEFPPGLGPDAYMDLPTPTPTPTLSDEDPEHFMPPGYGLVPELDSPPPDEEAGAPLVAAPSALDLQVQIKREDEESSNAAPASPPAQATLPAGPPAPTPPHEARRLLHQFAAAMASRQPGFCAGTWNPASLGFSGKEEHVGSSSRCW